MSSFFFPWGVGGPYWWNVNPILTDVSLSVCSWIMRPLYDVSCGRCVPVQTIPNWRRGGGGADIMLGRTVEAEGLAYLMQSMKRVR
jgi:hypothetical protein